MVIIGGSGVLAERTGRTGKGNWVRLASLVALGNDLTCLEVVVIISVKEIAFKPLGHQKCDRQSEDTEAGSINHTYCSNGIGL